MDLLILFVVILLAVMLVVESLLVGTVIFVASVRVLLWLLDLDL